MVAVSNMALFAASWNMVFNSTAGQRIVKNKLLATIPKLAKEWRVSFEVKPRSYQNRSSASVFHMTIGGRGSDPSDNYGDRTPALWLHGTKGVLVSSAVNRRACFPKWISQIPPLGRWTKIEVYQILKGFRYMFEILIDEDRVFSVENEKPEIFYDVKIFASSPWGAVQNGTIRKIIVETLNESDKSGILDTYTKPYTHSQVLPKHCLFDVTDDTD